MVAGCPTLIMDHREVYGFVKALVFFNGKTLAFFKKDNNFCEKKVCTYRY
jgi:hypothetical protein